ncbi:MAG: VOC family protein [Actinomycetota bacterium]
MNVRWSHCVLKAHNVDTLVDFYCDAFGWQVADRGGLGEMEIVFLSGSSTDHHQMAIMSGRPEGDGGSLDHNAFRVDSIADVKATLAKMSENPAVKYAVPITHGNAVSVYFVDPEGNGIEIFADTPMHVPQPHAGKWDPAMSDDEILADLDERYGELEGAMKMEAYRAQQAEVFGEA